MLRGSIQVFAAFGIVAKAVIDVLSGNGYAMAIAAAIILPSALLANRLQLSESQNLRAIARLFWSLLAGSVWTVLVMAVLLIGARQFWGQELSPVPMWGRYLVMGAVLLLFVALFYGCFSHRSARLATTFYWMLNRKRPSLVTRTSGNRTGRDSRYGSREQKWCRRRRCGGWDRKELQAVIVCRRCPVYAWSRAVPN
jgi:hypothetical protein